MLINNTFTYSPIVRVVAKRHYRLLTHNIIAAQAN